MNLEMRTMLAEMALFGLALWLRRRQPIGTSFPLVPGLLLGHLLLFGLPAVLYRDRLLESLDPAVLGRASLEVCVGMAALLAGERLPLAPMLVPFCPRLRIAWRANPRGALAALLAIGLTTMAIQKDGGPQWIFGAATVGINLGYVALAGLWLLALRGRIDRLAWRAPLLLATAAMCSLELIQGELAGLLLIGILLFTVYLHARHRIPWIALAGALPILFVLSGIKTALRTVAPDWNQADLAQRIENYRLAGATFWQDPAAFDVGETLLARMSDINLLAVVIEQTPEPVPYWRGATYQSLLWLPVPRFMAPGKPVLAADFGHRYGFLAADDDVTAVNMPAIVELYANFGGLGVVAGMFVVGITCRLLAMLFIDAQRSDACFAVTAALLAPFTMLVELPVVDTFGALAQHLPLLLLFLGLTGVCRIRLQGPTRELARAAGQSPREVPVA